MDKFEFIGPMCPAYKSENFQVARDAFSRLSVEESCVLLQEVLQILGSSGYQVVRRLRKFITAYIVMQIQSGNVDLSEVFKAAAHRVSQEETTD